MAKLRTLMVLTIAVLGSFTHGQCQCGLPSTATSACAPAPQCGKSTAPRRPRGLLARRPKACNTAVPSAAVAAKTARQTCNAVVAAPAPSPCPCMAANGTGTAVAARPCPPRSPFSPAGMSRQGGPSRAIPTYCEFAFVECCSLGEKNCMEEYMRCCDLTGERMKHVRCPENPTDP